LNLIQDSWFSRHKKILDCSQDKDRKAKGLERSCFLNSYKDVRVLSRQGQVSCGAGAGKDLKAGKGQLVLNLVLRALFRLGKVS
jgi:hypothetical protein